MERLELIASHFNGDESSSNMALKPTIAIVGSGWGGFTLAHALSVTKYNVLVISPTRTIQYTPLLASAAAGMCK